MSFVGRPIRQRDRGKTRVAVSQVARERIDILIQQARQNVERNQALSRRYIDLVRRISKRTKVRVPRETKRYLCKNCGIILVPGRNARVRLSARTGGVVITCLSCGVFRRYPVSRRRRTAIGQQLMKPYIVQSEPFSKKNSSKN